MKKYILAWILAAALFLTWCGRPETVDVWTQEDQRAPFFVEIISLEEIGWWSQIKKTGKVIWSQDIVVSSQASWRVNALWASIGDTVSKNKRIVTLADSTGIYTFSAQRANSWVTQAKLNYEQTVLSLDKAISDTQRAIQQAENQAQNSALWLWNSSAELQLKQLQTSLEKAEFDLQTKIDSDAQTLRNFAATTTTLVTTIQLLYEDVITTSDKLLWVSVLRKSENDQFERTLWVRNTGTRFLAEWALRTAIQRQIQVDSFVADTSETWLSTTLQTLKSYATQLQPLLDSIDTMLNFTDESSSFSQAQLDATIAQINWLQSQTQGQVSSITQQINSIESFLNTYKQSQESIRQSISWLESQLWSTKEQLKTVSTNANLWVESAQSTYNNTIKNKSTTEASLRNAITQAQIAASEAQTNLWKLTIEAPIEWTIWDILVDIWQEVAPWTPLFTITNTQQQEIEIALTSDEVDRVEQGQQVTVVSWGEQYNATLVSIASSSNATLWYKAIVRLDENTALVWWAATVQIWLSSDSLLLPLKYVKILNKNSGQITVWQENNLETIIVTLWKVRWSSIEILDPLGKDTVIVTNNVNNYDPNKFTLTPKS